MTHLPECRLAHKCHGLTGADGEHAMKMDYCVACRRPCICEELRACEQRVRTEALQQAKAREANGITWAQAYAAALRDAGQAIPHAAFCLAHGMSNANDLDCDCGRTDAVAAIRALKGEQ